MSDDNKDYGFYNPHSGLKGRDGGPYLDQLERQNAEVNRAVQEGREPDFSKPLPATAGVPLVSAAQVVDNSLTSNPSMASRPGFEVILSDASLGDNGEDKPSFVKPVNILPVDVGTEPFDAEADTVSDNGPYNEDDAAAHNADDEGSATEGIVTGAPAADESTETNPYLP